MMTSAAGLLNFTLKACRPDQVLPALCLATVCCATPAEAPRRPGGVPLDAKWAGGIDGGAWITCSRHEQRAGRWRCKVYHESTGEAVAYGLFAGPADSAASFEPVSFDGWRRITLTNGRALIAVDTMTYPLDASSGKRQVFSEAGEPIGAEWPYGPQ